MKIVPLNQTKTDTSLLVEAAQKTLGINIGCDENPKNLIIASKIFNVIKTDLDAVRNMGILLRHFHYSFLVLSDKDLLFRLLTETYLDIIHVETTKKEVCLSIVSSDLDTWRDVVITLCDETKDVNLRTFANIIWQYFDDMNFGQIFINYRRKKLKDETFLLEKK